MRHALLIAFALALFGCGDDSDTDHAHEHDSGPKVDAGPSPDAGPGKPGTKLERPGLPRPPTDGLPDDLRPPR